MQLTGGTGNNKPAGVTDDNHLATAARTISHEDAEALLGNAYVLSSLTITSTGSAEATGLLYAKNTGSSTLVVTAVELALGASTSGTGDGVFEVLMNPDAGTTISTATAQAPVNRKPGSSDTLTGNFYKGADGETITNGTVLLIESLVTPAGRFQFTEAGHIVLGPGDAIGLRYTTQTSNSSQAIQASMSMYKLTLGV